MPRMHALELLPDEAGAEVVRRDWQALHDAGLPSQLAHRGTTNSPHVTVVAAPALAPIDEQRAVSLLGTLLPIEVTLARRISRVDVPSALEVLGHRDVVLSMTTLRRWDPDAGTVTIL